MPNIRMVLEYDGAPFHGWQKQPGLRTVQQDLQRVLEMVLRQEIGPPCGASRTDAGVHAKGQVVNFRVSESPDLGALQCSVNGVLRGDLAVLEANIVPDDFHSRYAAKCKQYTYTILNRPQPAVLNKGLVWQVRAPLDLERIKEQAMLLVGEHDFKSFQAVDCNSKSSIKRILESEIISDPPYVYYRVVGTGFLKQMVRSIVGTLVALGKEHPEMPPLPELLALRDRTRAGVTAPARGLCLDWVRY